jgi:hypothetical protein
MARQKKSNDVNVKTFKGNTAGGGSATNKTGLTFEEVIENDFQKKLKDSGYVENGNDILKNGRVCATRYKKHDLYKILCEGNGINWEDMISGKKLPDDAIFVNETKTLHIIEKKYQKSSGSNDEKLESPHFKIRQYNKLLKPLNIKIKYCYVLSDWFRLEKNRKYKDVYDYHKELGVKHFFNELPLSYLGL